MISNSRNNTQEKSHSQASNLIQSEILPHNSGQSLTPRQNSLAKNFITQFKKIIKKRKFLNLIIIGGFLLIILGTLLIYSSIGSQKEKLIFKDQELEASPSPALAVTPPPKQLPSPSPTIRISPSPVLIVKPTPSHSPVLTPSPSLSPASPLPTPSPTTEAPQMRITYPTNDQHIEMTADKQVCVVEIPIGGDRDGLEVKRNINGQGWSSYQPYSTYCFLPSDGSNKYEAQFKNSFGQESPIHHVEFTFRKI